MKICRCSQIMNKIPFNTHLYYVTALETEVAKIGLLSFWISIFVCLKMLDLYLLGQNCLHLTFKPYLSSETYSRQYEKLPNIVVHACKILQKRCIC